MRQLLPEVVDPVDVAALYGDLPPAASRPSVRVNMIASVDGATEVAGRSGGLGGKADSELFHVMRSLTDAILVAAGTVRSDRYGPSRIPIAIVTRSCALDWDSALFTDTLGGAAARPIVVTVAAAPAKTKSHAPGRSPTWSWPASRTSTSRRRCMPSVSAAWLRCSAKAVRL